MILSREIQGTHKRNVRFQKLTRNLFLALHGHNVRNTFHIVIFGTSNSLLALATDLRGLRKKRLTHSFKVVIRHTRSTRTLAFTQASSCHKLSVPLSYVIPAWCVFSKPCTKLTLHCHRQLL